MKRPLLLSLLAGLSMTFALGRFLIPTRPHLSAALSYEALAHVFVGGLLGAWLVCRDRWLLGLALALSAVELLAFIFLR